MTGPSGDARTLLGMDTKAAWAIAGFYLCALTSLAVSTWDDAHRRWPIVTALLMTAAVTAVLLVARRDPLSPVPTVVLTASVPAASLLVLLAVPYPPTSPAQLWVFGAGTATATFMCVRGRTGAAWIGLCAMIATAALRSETKGYGAAHGLGLSVINLAPLLMATFFAYTIRPAAREIFALHEESTRRSAAEAAASATLAERRDQLLRLDHKVRPILERIAGPDPLGNTDLAECRSVEAHLRDTLRAPALAVEPVTTAARAARERGLDVVLIDDRGLDGVSDEIRDRLLRLVAAELDQAPGGTVTIRILPPDRGLLATIVGTHPVDGTRRVEITISGVPRESAEKPVNY
ncbi:hypothetical protein [Nocardia puris]|uniref:hypothetical protein n=1 Tax=Nocardia puris TaxID=208602 RepID=UPI002E1A7C21